MHGGGYAGALLVMIWPLLPTIEPGGTTEPGGNTVPPVTGMGILANMPCAAGRSSGSWTFCLYSAPGLFIYSDYCSVIYPNPCAALYLARTSNPPP